MVGCASHVLLTLTLMRPCRFDIISFGFDSEEDSKGMLETVHSLNQLITAEVDSGIEPGNIVLGGFSQGATMSLLTGLSSERKLGGIVVLSGWLPLRDRFKAVSIHQFLANCRREPYNDFSCRWRARMHARHPYSGVTASSTLSSDTSSASTPWRT